MSRLASQEKLGFYKTPVTVIEQIKQVLNIEPGCRVLDPCCGEGEAIKTLSSGNTIETLGVELDRGRYNIAKDIFDRVHLADALTEVKITQASLDLLFLNPPYDYDDGAAHEKRERLEIQFFRKYFTKLAVNGLMIFIVPLSILKVDTLIKLLSRLSDLEIYRFPDSEFEMFRQIVIFARRKRVNKKKENLNREMLYRLKFALRNEIETTDDLIKKYSEDKIQIIKKSKDDYKFEALRIDPIELTPLTNELKDSFLSSVSLSTIKTINPVMP